MSHFSQILKYSSTAAFPISGNVSILYLAQDTIKLYEWDGTSYNPIASATEGWNGDVATFADLPTAASHNGEVWLVTSSSGVWPFNHPAGLYISNGSSWTEAPMTAGSLTYADVIDNLTSTDTNKPLSANQGKVLQDNKQALLDKDATGGYVGLTLFKINFKNAANTFTSFFTNTNSAIRTYVFQDRNGTIADDTDLAAKQDTLTATNFGSFIVGLTAKTTPADADSMNLVDSAASNLEKKVTWANVKATLKTYFDTLYQSVLTLGTGVLTALGINVGSAGAFVVNGGALGTPSSGTATNLTGTASGLTSGNVITNANLTGDVSSSGNATTLATVNSNIGTFGSTTKTSIVTVNAKGLVTAASESTVTPAIGSITGLGTGVSTALATNVGSAGAPVVNGGALGTPSSGVATNLTGTAAGLTTGTVTTNANLSGDVSSVGNTTTIGAGKVTEAMQVLADNTTNNVSTSKHGYAPKAPNDATKYLDGTGAYSVPGTTSGYKFGSIQTFTASGTWTKPASCVAYEVWVIGGGGGSGGAQPGANNGNASGGGGGGGCAYKFVTSPNSSETVTIGAGGSAGATNGNGGTGGTSSLGSICSATGGVGSINANGATGSQVGGNGGAGGVGSSGTVNLTGKGGGTASRDYSQGGLGGDGGNSPGEFGGGGAAGGATTNTGVAGVAGIANSGGGAAGAASDYNSGSSYAGAAGGSGFIVVKEYY